MPKPNVGQKCVQKGDWLLFSKTDSLTFSNEWLEGKKCAREKYYLVDCGNGEAKLSQTIKLVHKLKFLLALADFDSAERIALWIADIC